jgi:hypothetical protein
MSTTFNPFERHVGKPEPAQTQPGAESTGKQPADSKPATEPNSGPEDQSSPAGPVPPRAARAENPFGHHEAAPKARLEPERTRKPLSATELLVWIRRDWGKPTISLRDIQAYAPRALRDRETLLKRLEILAQHGWLVEIRAHRRDRRVWRLPPAAVTTTT